MELLVQLVAEFLLLPALAAALHAGTVLLALIEALFWGAARVTNAAAAIRARAWMRRLRWVLLAVLGAAVAGVLLLNTVLFEPSLRWAFARIRARSGLEVTFASAEGNFLSGRAVLKDVALRRAGDPRSNFDLRAKEVRLDVRMMSALLKDVAFESLEISGLEGTYERVSPRGSRSRGRDFTIDRLLLEDSRIRFRDRPLDEKTAEMTVAIERLECLPFRRQTAVFDALFRSNAAGTIDGAPFTIRTERTDGGRKTAWSAKGLPLRFLADYAGGAFAWFRSGTADLDVVDSWSDGDRKEIDMHWKLRLRAFTADVPPGLAGWKRPLVEAGVAFLNRHPAELPLEFDLAVTQDQFTGAASVEATGLLVAVGGAAAKEIARLAGVPVETIKDFGKRTLDGFKEYLDRWRKTGKEK